MRLVLDRREEVAAWVAAHLGIAHFDEPYQAIGFERSGQLVGGHVYEGMTEHDIRIHIAGSGAVARGSCRVFWDYVFNQLKRKRVTAIIRSRNDRMRSIVERLGFQREGECRLYFGDDNAVIYGLLADEASPWMRT